PLRIESFELSRSMKYYIGNIHWLDALTPPLERHLEALAETVARLLPAGRDGGRAGGGPSPHPPASEWPEGPSPPRQGRGDAVVGRPSASSHGKARRWPSVIVGALVVLLPTIGVAMWASGLMSSADRMKSDTGI